MGLGNRNFELNNQVNGFARLDLIREKVIDLA